MRGSSASFESLPTFGFFNTDVKSPSLTLTAFAILKQYRGMKFFPVKCPCALNSIQ